MSTSEMARPSFAAVSETSWIVPWLKPSTFIGGAGFIFMLATALFSWGGSSNGKVTKDQLKQTLQVIPTKVEMDLKLAAKADKDNVGKLWTCVELMKSDITYIRNNQRQQFKQINAQLDALLKAVLIQRRRR